MDCMITSDLIIFPGAMDTTENGLDQPGNTSRSQMVMVILVLCNGLVFMHLGVSNTASVG